MLTSVILENNIAVVLLICDSLSDNGYNWMIVCSGSSHWCCRLELAKCKRQYYWVYTARNKQRWAICLSCFILFEDQDLFNKWLMIVQKVLIGTVDNKRLISMNMTIFCWGHLVWCAPCTCTNGHLRSVVFSCE